MPEREVEQDSIGIGNDGAPVVQDRDLAEWVQPQERLGLLLLSLQVHVDQLMRQSQERQEKLRPVGVAGETVPVKPDPVVR